jgi:hypothetical protein
MIYNFPDHISGDTWRGFNLTILENETPLDLTDCDIYIQFRPAHNLASPVFLELSSDKNDISIVLPLSGLISVSAKNINIPTDKYNYDLQVNFPNGHIKTYVNGTVYISPQITRK